MPDHATYDYAVLRVVPRVERGECINVGVVLWCAARALLDARVELDVARLTALDPTIDVELVQRHLASIAAICRGGDAAGAIGRLPASQRFGWITAPRSTIVQASAVHTGKCDDCGSTLERLMDQLVRPARPTRRPA